MAVNEMQNPSSLRIKLNLGMEDGKYDAPAQDVYDVAEALIGLQEYDQLEIAKIDNTTLA